MAQLPKRWRFVRGYDKPMGVAIAIYFHYGGINRFTAVSPRSWLTKSQAVSVLSFHRIIMDPQSLMTQEWQREIPTSAWKTVSGWLSHILLMFRLPPDISPKASLARVMRYDHQIKRPVWAVLFGRCRCKINAHLTTSFWWLHLGVTFAYIPKWLRSLEMVGVTLVSFFCVWALGYGLAMKALRDWM